jgi:hypothetical protein
MEQPKKRNKKQLSMEDKIRKIYEQFPEPTREVNNWNHGGFVNEEKYKQPIKHKKYR